MTPSELAKKFWDAANAVTGFACLQSIAISVLVINRDVELSLCRRDLIGFINDGTTTAIIAVVLYFMFGIAAWLLSRRGEQLVKLGNVSQSFGREILASWRYMNRGRIVAILVFSIINLLVLSGFVIMSFCQK
jgi:hypothetical protein